MSHPIHISEAGSTIITDKPFPDHLPENYPLRLSYKQFTCADGIGRSSWDVTAVAWLLNTNDLLIITAPLPSYDHLYTQNSEGYPMRYVYFINSSALMQDLIQKLSSGQDRQ